GSAQTAGRVASGFGNKASCYYFSSAANPARYSVAIRSTVNRPARASAAADAARHAGWSTSTPVSAASSRAAASGARGSKRWAKDPAPMVSSKHARSEVTTGQPRASASSGATGEASPFAASDG